MTAATHEALLHAGLSSPRATPITHAGVEGGPRVLLRLEGAALLLTAAIAYASLGGGWLLFAVLFLVPDLSLLGYLAGPRIGAAVYNAGHSTLGPAALAALGLALSMPTMWLVALIWVAHIGFDRMAGYGLKYASQFRDTHLGQIGRARASCG